MEINSTNYGDYFIKNGKLIGEFEQMYQKASTIPWHQDEQEGWIDVKLSVDLLSRLDINSIFDFGCGLGYYLDILCKKLRREGDIIGGGADISPTAIGKAQRIFNEYDFEVYDLIRNVPKKMKFTPPRKFRSRNVIYM